MEKTTSFIKKNKIIMFIFWLVLLYLLVLGIYFFFLRKTVSITEIIFIFAIGCFVYVDVELFREYIKSKKITDGIKSIENRYEFIKTYIEENTMIIEIQKKEAEKLKKDVKELNITMEELKQDNELIKFFIRL